MQYVGFPFSLHWIFVTGHGLFLVVVHGGFSLVVALRFNCPVACEILVPQSGMEQAFPCMGRQILNHWTTREVPKCVFLASDFSHLALKLLGSSML